MIFSSKTKDELCWLMNKKEQDDLAEGYGMLLFSKCITMQDKVVKFENANVARLISVFSDQLAGVIPEIRTKYHSKVNMSESTYFSIPGEDQKRMLFEAFGHRPEETGIKINRNIAGKSPSAFLRGAFLACGNISDPQKEYHLEFIAGYRTLAEDMLDFIVSLGIDLQPSISERNSSYILYIKDSGKIEDFLTYIGASKASMELMQIKMYKEAMNDINRRTNFETANMDRTISASAKQVLAIALINDTVGFSFLSPELKELCELRLENPDMSLKAMSEKLGISRSGVNHRLQRIMKIAEECSDNDKIKELINR